MTKVTINPGVCGLITSVTAQSEDQMEVNLTVSSACESVQRMADELGSTLDAYDICLKRPGDNALFENAMTHFPVHAGCPTLSGIIKCIEVECRLALPKEVSIIFE